jgi:SAM-dependent methyltransferase
MLRPAKLQTRYEIRDNRTGFQMTLAFRSDETSPFVHALLADQGIPADSVLLDVDARDEMLEFLLSSFEGDRERALFAYFRSGLSIADAMTQILRWRFRDPARIERVLDFASGYGRVTRFLLREVPAERFWVSDIYADAVRFQQERFGVHGVVSTILPEDFACAERFDAILVTSLFTHLPEERFVGWLRRLLSLLRPGGMLLFSVHDEAILAPGVTLPSEGLLFQELSESNSLETSDYGSTWVDEAFVRRALERASDEPVSLWRSPRGLCNFQDLYVAVREEGVDFSGLTLHAEPWLQIDRCAPRIDPATGQRTDVLEMRGWTLMRSGEARAVQVSVDGQVLGTAPVDGPRPDVAALVGERFARSGWELTARLPPGISRNGSILIVRVVDGRGAGHPLWASTVETAFLASARQDADYLYQVLTETRARFAETEARAAADLAALQARIAAMEASRFWKLRNAWFRFKGMLGITG